MSFVVFMTAGPKNNSVKEVTVHPAADKCAATSPSTRCRAERREETAASLRLYWRQ